MNQINANKSGLVVGGMFALLHALWSVLVFSGWAQPLMNFIFWAHMMNPPYVTSFSITQSLTLIIMTAIIGYIIGNISACFWNYLNKEEMKV